MEEKDPHDIMIEILMNLGFINIHKSTFSYNIANSYLDFDMDMSKQDPIWYTDLICEYINAKDERHYAVPKKNLIVRFSIYGSEALIKVSGSDGSISFGVNLETFIKIFKGEFRNQKLEKLLN